MLQRWLATTFIFLSAAICAVPNGAIAQDAPAGSSSLQVFVDATAKDGAPVTLDPTMLTVSIDKKAAIVISADAATDERLLFAVMVDMSSSEKPKEKELKDSAVQIFQGLSAGNSHGDLVLFNVQAYPSKRPLLPPEVQVALNRIQFSGGTALYDSVAQVCSGVLNRSKNTDNPRRVLIILSDGDDNYSHIVEDKMEEIAQRESVSIFSLSEYASEGASKGNDVLARFARSTGGTQIIAKSMADGIPKLVAAIRGQSMLRIASPQAGDTKLHSLSIKSPEKGVSISAPARILIQ